MRIGEVAKALGVNIETLRYYERRGLLAEPSRTASGYRDYDGDALTTVRFIKRAQGFGFTLDEVEQLLALRRGDETPLAEVRARVGEKVAELDEKLGELQRARDELAGLVSSCQARDTTPCAILEGLAAGAAGAGEGGDEG